MVVHHTTSGEWCRPLVADALDTPGIWTIKEYIQMRQYTISFQVAFRSIYELCTGLQSMPGDSRFMWWWDDDVGQEVELPGDECSFKT